MPNLLETIQSPADLRKLERGKLPALAGELRQRIIDAVSAHGGHLASNLGVVELTIALHRVFDFAKDRLLWDVGHQCYVHKLLTGRQAGFDKLRQPGGVSGFPNIAESNYDLFSTGHAGTALPTAVGLARGDDALGRDARVAAVVGDASIVNGVALEGLNQAGTLKRQFLAVLNDNSMGISRTQGALASYLARLRTSGLYDEMKRRLRNTLHRVPVVGEGVADILEHLRDGLKATVSPGGMFEQFGFLYLGPVDGHDVDNLIDLLELVRNIEQPVLLHVHTEKGRGCSWAAEDPCAFHSPGRLEFDGDQVSVVKSDRKNWTTALADAVIEIGQQDPRVVALTAAMPDGTGVAKIRKALPDRAFDCGLAESGTVDIAAGMAKAGLRPLVCIYSTFLQRAFDQVFQEVVLQQLPVIFCIDRAGPVGGDGAVHHGYLDIAFLRGFQNMTLLAPADEAELGAALRFAIKQGGPAAIRYPRDMVPQPLGPAPEFELGRARLLREGPDATILAYGTTVSPALAAAEALAREDIYVAVVAARFAKPIDEEMLTDALSRGRPVLTAEEHSLAGGFGGAALEVANRLGLPTENVMPLGMAVDRFYHHASRGEQLAEAGLDAAGIAAAVRRAVRAADRPVEDVERTQSPRGVQRL